MKILSMIGVFVVAGLCQMFTSAAITQGDVSLKRTKPDPQQLPCPRQMIELQCEIMVPIATLIWTLPTRGMLEFGILKDVGFVRNSSDSVYSASLTGKRQDDNPENDRVFFTSTLLILEPDNQTTLTCTGSGGVDPVEKSTTITLSGTPDPPHGLNYNVSVVIESSVDLQWTQPSYTGGVDVVKYNISSTNGITVTVDDSSEVVQYSPGLVYGEVQVSAINTCDMESRPAVINITAAVPLPPNIMVHFTCESLPWNISWEYKRDKGVVYPNVKSTLDLLDETLSSVPLPSGDPACSDTTPGSTNCSLTVQFPKDIYNVSVSLTNTFGSTMNSSMFDTRAIIVENEVLEEDELSVTVTVNTVCTIWCHVTVSFGTQPISNGSCDFQHNVTSKEPLSPGETYIFTGGAIALKSGEEYCYLVTLCRTPVRQGSGGGLSPGAIAGSTIAATVASVILTLACCCGVFLWATLRAKCYGYKKIVIDVEMEEEGQKEQTQEEKAAPHRCYGCNKTDEELSGLFFTCPLTIRHEVWPGEELYAMPSQKSMRKEEEEGKKELKSTTIKVKEKKEEKGQELTEEEKAALYSVPDKNRQTTNGEEVSVEGFLPTLEDGARNARSYPPPKRQKTNGEEVLRKEEKEEEGQKELTEEEKTAPHSVPDKKRVKIKSEGLIYADVVIMSNLNPAPPMPEEPTYTVVQRKE